MAATDSPQGNALSDIFGTKELFQLAMQKLSSQLLVFSLVVVVLLVAGWKWIGPEGLPLILAVLFVFLVATVGYLFAEAKRKVASGDPATMSTHLNRRVDQITNKGAPFTVKLWTIPAAKKAAAANAPGGATDARDIAVAATAPPASAAPASYRIGEAIKVGFSADRDCYLTLLNIGTSGKLTVLFPNAMQPDNFIAADSVHEIPGPDAGFEYRLQGPPGREGLKAVATLDKVDLGAAHFTPEGDLFRTVSAVEGARDIAVIQTRVTELKQETWTEARTVFTVSP